MVINICVICKKEFIHTRRSHQTCSKKCFYELLSIGKIGKLNPMFSDGCRQYVRLMSNINLCQNCGRKYHLDIHHKDGNHNNNVKENLLKVCRRCHMLLDGRMKNLNYNNSGIGINSPDFKRGEL